MHKPLSNDERLEQNRQYYKIHLKQIKPNSYPLNIKLANNPFLKNEDKFQYIIYHLNQYNKRVDKQLVTDPYEMASYQKLHSMISDIAQMDTKNDQLQALNEVYNWYKQQHRIVQQRRHQGEIRYQMTNEYRKFTQLSPQVKATHIEENIEDQIPSQLINRLLQPYRWGNRTTHKQLEVPLRRLNQYKRKVINIAPFIQAKELAKPARILYPMPPKFQPKQQQQQPKQGEEGVQNKQIQAPIEGQQIGQDGQPILQQKKQENQQPEQDLGGFGQEPEQPDEQQPAEDTGDKLAPKNKLYISAISNNSNEKYYRGQYMRYRGQQSPSERSLEQRYLKLQQQILVNQRQDKLNIQLATERARKKSKMVKQIQKKLQDMIHQPNYSILQEQASPPEKFSKEDDLKFGFTMNLRPKPKYSQVDFTQNTTLPQIKNDSFQEKTIRRDRIQSLKSKFSKLLNLTEYQERQTAPSMCQYTARRRGLSEIIRNHSKSKERLNQLDEVASLKEKLTRNKIGINIRALSQGLCIPDSQQNSVPPPQNIFPNKQLPSNPFMVETKKKKKKKK